MNRKSQKSTCISNSVAIINIKTRKKAIQKTGIGSGIEFQPETEIRCIFVFSVLGYNEDFIKKK